MAVRGRPTSYTEEMLQKAKDYAEDCSVGDDVVPSIVGLCAYIGRSKSIVYDWIKDPEKADFSDICQEINEKQEKGLINGGLAGGFAPAVTKMMLSKHGYSDKVETDHTSSDGSMSPAKDFNAFYDESES